MVTSVLPTLPGRVTGALEVGSGMEMRWVWGGMVSLDQLPALPAETTEVVCGSSTGIGWSREEDVTKKAFSSQVTLFPVGTGFIWSF